MRHLLSVVLGLVLSPLIYVAAGFAAVKFSEANDGGSIQYAAAALFLLAALVAGSLYAILVMARLSPLGLVLAGLIYLGVTFWALISPSNFVSTLPKSFLGEEGILYAPVGVGTVILAVPLLITVFSPRRWRRSAQPAAVVGYQAAPTYGDTVPSAAPTYGSTFEPTVPSYEPPVYTPPSQYNPSDPTLTDNR